MHPPSCDPAPKPFDLENGIRVTCDVGYLSANFSLPRPFFSRLRPDVRDRQTDRHQINVRQTDVRQHHRLMPRLGSGGIITSRKLQVQSNRVTFNDLHWLWKAHCWWTPQGMFDRFTNSDQMRHCNPWEKRRGVFLVNQPRSSTQGARCSGQYLGPLYMPT